MYGYEEMGINSSLRVSRGRTREDGGAVAGSRRSPASLVASLSAGTAFICGAFLWGAGIATAVTLAGAALVYLAIYGLNVAIADLAYAAHRAGDALMRLLEARRSVRDRRERHVRERWNRAVGL